MVGVFQKARVDLHLTAQYGLKILGHSFPCRDLLVAFGELAIRRNDTECLLSGEGLLSQFVPSLVELALVLVGPILGDMVRRVGCARSEVNEKWFVGCDRLFLRDPGQGLIGHVLDEVVALFGCFFRLDRRGPFVERWVPLVGLTADKAVEILKTAAARRPGVEWAGRARLPD